MSKTSLKTLNYFANFGWTVLSYPPYSLDLVQWYIPTSICSGCMDDIFLTTTLSLQLWKSRLLVQIFLSEACSFLFIVDVNAKSVVVTIWNKRVFCSWKPALSNYAIVLPLAVVVSVEINRMHYFWIIPRIPHYYLRSAFTPIQKRKRFKWSM